jgi:hypothetical protein
MLGLPFALGADAGAPVLSRRANSKSWPASVPTIVMFFCARLLSSPDVIAGRRRPVVRGALGN